MTAQLVSAVAAAWLAFLGLSVGSFLNVVIARVPAGLSVVRPRSRCPRCGHMLSWYENIPVFSWLGLRGRCRSCRLPISVRYPLVELLTGALFVACLWRFGWSPELVRALVLVGLLVPLTFIDAEHWVLPFVLTLPGIAVGILSALLVGQDALEEALWGAAIGFLLFRALEFFGWLAFKKEALGGGDKYLLALLGAFLTHRALLGIVLLASLQGALFGIASLLATGRAGPAPTEPEAEGADAPQDAPPTMTWGFLRPGLPWWRRLLALPGSLLLQPIPDDPGPPEDTPEGEQDTGVAWTPDVRSLPFGPWLALAGVEVLLLGPWLARAVPDEVAFIMFGVGG